MQKRKWFWILGIAILLLLLFVLLAVLQIRRLHTKTELWGYARQVPEAERFLRDQVVTTAQQWYGCKESDGSHKPIVDIYNDHEPLAQGYAVSYEDAWCATFDSTVAIQCGLTEIIPTECSCERQIELFRKIGAWQEADNYLPLPGDYIFYHWNCLPFSDCTHWSDHVGIVVGTWRNWIKVVEGNRDDAVAYRWIRVDSWVIRGFGVPDYAGFAG